MLDLQRQLFSDQYQSIEIDDQSFLYLLQENTTAITRGVAVMVADSGVSVAGQEGFEPLANELNKLGWVTIILPAPNTAFVPSAPETGLPPDTSSETDEIAKSTSTPNEEESLDEPTSDLIDNDLNSAFVSTISDQAFAQHEQQLIELLEAAFDKSQDYPGFFFGDK